MLRYSLLDEALVRYRRVGDGEMVHVSLPELFVALAANEVRDFPALRSHQRHPWYAFLCQLAAITLHHADRNDLFATAEEWKAALLALTPNDPDGAAWCLITPPERPAFLQAPVPKRTVSNWKTVCRAADELDMLVTSRNHDLKAARARRATTDEWLYALLSIQTQEGFLGQGNYGISRMNGGFSSRPGIGIVEGSSWGGRWYWDTRLLLNAREHIADTHDLPIIGGHALLWLLPWDGNQSLQFSSLDPLYIEICRRVRLQCDGAGLFAMCSGTRAARVAAKDLNGVTGDPWTPVETTAGKALSLTGEGFHYKLLSELLFGGKFTPGVAHSVNGRGSPLYLIARAVARGQGKTEGYHERQIPISPRMRSWMQQQQHAMLAKIAHERIAAIAEVRSLLWQSLVVLFNNGDIGKDASDSVKDKAKRFSKSFEQGEDGRFFIDLTEEVESDTPENVRLHWMLGVVDRADAILRAAFDAGPRSAMRRYHACAAALSRFHGALRRTKSPLPLLAQHYQNRTNQEDVNV